jgi:SAM-dependent methyltransferase
MDRRTHWDTVYSTKGERDVSWFEAVPTVSMQLMEAAGLRPDTCVIDVGGGDSHLIDALVARGLQCLTVLDVSSAALRRAQARLAAASTRVTWVDADVTGDGDWSQKAVDIWHDRAVFHFLTAPHDRVQYLAHLRQTLKPHGAAIISTFALEGPATCSGLPVVRYSAETLAAELGGDFRLIESLKYDHGTPWGAIQPFVYARFERGGTADRRSI